MTEKIVFERTYRANVAELWELWTTKAGFESWWGPQGFRVEVHAIEPSVGGRLHYDMIAQAPEAIAALQKMGHAPSHETRGTFEDVRPNERIALCHIIDFIPGVAPYEMRMVAEFFPSGDQVRMLITVDAAHSEEFTKMSQQGMNSQLEKLDARFRAAAAPR